jgi:hypothetical protein
LLKAISRLGYDVTPSLIPPLAVSRGKQIFLSETRAGWQIKIGYEIGLRARNSNLEPDHLITGFFERIGKPRDLGVILD